MWRIRFRVNDMDDTMIIPIYWKHEDFRNRGAAEKYLVENGYKEIKPAKNYRRFVKLTIDEDDDCIEIHAHLGEV